MYKVINFDMDGTLADFYGQPNWKESLENQKIEPYKNAKPMLHFPTLARKLNALQRKGYVINIISWNSKGATYEYAEAVRQAKLEWLQRHLPSVHWDGIYIVTFGAPKHLISKGILFDDDYGNCFEWMDANAGDAFHPDDIIYVLRKLEAVS